MIRKLVYITILIFAACKVPSSLTLDGVYENRGSDYSYILELKPDSLFTVVEHRLDVKKTCSGLWKFIDENSILLTCDKGRDTDVLLSSYMVEREIEVKVLNSKRIDYKGIILMRK